jgi:phage host-nuclease inhibitor protein Gam
MLHTLSNNEIKKVSEEIQPLENECLEIELETEPYDSIEFTYTPDQESLNKAFDLLFQAVIDTCSHKD